MRYAQKNGIKKVKRDNQSTQFFNEIKRDRRKHILEQWRNPAMFQTTQKLSLLRFSGYKTPTQIKARWKKMKKSGNKKA